VSEADPLSAEQIVAELQKAKVDEFLLHTCSLLASLGYGKLTGEALDLEQARLAIEALKALTPLVTGEATGEIKAVLSSLQLAYAEATSQ
jgi:hypothetical protein